MGEWSIFLASDGTGETGGRFLAAALHQFEQGGSVQVTKWTHLRTQEQADKMIREAEQVRALVLHTIVNEELRTYLAHRCRDAGLPTRDLLGPLLESLERFLDAPSQEEAGRLHSVNDHYFRRMEAIEFTLHHDDGRSTRELRNAEIILLGVSRTSKTPTSVYLAQEGYKVVNIPIVRGQPLPEELFTVEPRRVIGLTIDPVRLGQIRRERLARMGTTESDSKGYIDPTNIESELQYAHKIFSRNRSWAVIDVTNRSIEETAREILDTIYGRTRPLLPA